MRSNPLIGEGNTIPKLQKLRADYSSYVSKNLPNANSRQGARNWNQSATPIRSLGAGIRPNVPLSRSSLKRGSQGANSNLSIGHAYNTLEVPNMKNQNSFDRRFSQNNNMNATVNFREQNNSSAGEVNPPPLMPEMYNNLNTGPQFPTGGGYNAFTPQNFNPVPMGYQMNQNLMQSAPMGQNTMINAPMNQNMAQTMPMNTIDPSNPYASFTPQKPPRAPMVSSSPQTYASPPSNIPGTGETDYSALNNSKELAVNSSFESAATISKPREGEPGHIETPQNFDVSAKYKQEEKALLNQFLQKQMYEKKIKDEEERIRKLKEEADEDSRIMREQDEISRKQFLENDARHAFRRQKNLPNYEDTLPRSKKVGFLSNVIVKEPKANAFDDEYWQAKRNSKKYFDHFPQDVRVGELQRLLELKFQNSQTELKRVFHENMREIKLEIDSKQTNMAKHLRDLKNIAQREREEKDKLQLEVERLNREKINLAEREEIVNSILRNDMTYKTPPLPKIKSAAEDIRIDFDTKGYNTHPINVTNTTSYISRNTAVPYYENIDTSMLENSNHGLDDVLDFEGETDIISAGDAKDTSISRIRTLQKDRLTLIGDIEKNMNNNRKIDISGSLNRMRKAKAKPLRFTSGKKSTINREMRNKMLVQDYDSSKDGMKELDYQVEDSLSHSFKPRVDNTIKINTSGYGNSDDSEIKFPSPGLLNFNDV
ncbi:unnamed protein product [Moneuplotes crassus]|uniref:Uncharacterized protein n=1 Tax=Euplotes crassus TaxID=5936 RepID=A0AAD1TYU7_EUPCR|nr:unnamed protein product [Moneuplotes crassus]